MQEGYTTGAACLTDVSSGQVSATFPTTGGPVTIVGALHARRLALTEFIEIAFPQIQFSGVAIDIPTQGDCLTAPLTQALATVTGTMIG